MTGTTGATGAGRLALHTWTLDSTPLAEVLAVARRTGWGGVELRRLDFLRAREAGRTDADTLELVRRSGLPVACVGVELGWMFADDPTRRRILGSFAESCRWAVALGCPRLMSPVDFATGDVARAVEGVREVGDLAAAHGLRLAVEHQSQAPQLNTLDRVRELLARAGHPTVGLLLDSYHLHRSPGGIRAIEDVAPSEIAYVQFSDVPAAVEPGKTQPRLPAGEGTVPFPEFLALLAAKGYTGWLSYEAPDPAAWARDPATVADEARGRILTFLTVGERRER
jgi:sugar phosphate isomerase/epimerase